MATHAQEHLPDLEQVPVEERDQVWLDHYYQGDAMPQLTFRAVAMGMLLGGVMSLSNLYVGLKTGWGLGVAITACILSYAIWTSLLRAGIAKTPMSILENNCMQSTASSAGYSTGGTMVSCIAAYLILTGENIPFWILFWWTIFLALLGVAVAVPMKRQMINREQLKFPSGMAAAETLRSLHASGDEALAKARALFWSMGLAAAMKWFIDGNAALFGKIAETSKAAWAQAMAKVSIPGELPIPFWKPNGREAEQFGLALPVDPILIAAGAITGMRTGLSMALGAFVLYGVMGPWLDSHHVFAEMHALGAVKSDDPTRGSVRAWGLWTGSAMMVTAGLTAFAFQWRSVIRAFSGLGAILGLGGGQVTKDPLAHIEVPGSWFAAGTFVAGLGCVVIMDIVWGIAWYWGIVAVLFAFVLSLVACRATGETDTTPIGAMGKVTQLFYGVTIQGNSIANLMTAGVTAGAASSSADLLTDLKSGYLLGANPRQQTIAQALGIIAGTVVVVPAWYFLVSDPSVISGDSPQYAAPAAAVWASVAKLLANGLGSLHPTIVTGMAVGALLGIALTVVDGLAPGNVRRWLPSPTGLGLSFVIYFPDSMSFLIGALLGWIYTKIDAKKADFFVIPVASGIIAGGSLMGVAVALAMAGGLM